MILLIYLTLLFAYAFLIKIYYQSKKYKIVALWVLMFCCVLFLMIQNYKATGNLSL